MLMSSALFSLGTMMMWLTGSGHWGTSHQEVLHLRMLIWTVLLLLCTLKIDRLIAWLTDCFGWLVGWLVDWLIDWLIDWLVAWLLGCLVGGLIDCLIDALILWSMDKKKMVGLEKPMQQQMCTAAELNAYCLLHQLLQ